MFKNILCHLNLARLGRDRTATLLLLVLGIAPLPLGKSPTKTLASAWEGERIGIMFVVPPLGGIENKKFRLRPVLRTKRPHYYQIFTFPASTTAISHQSVEVAASSELRALEIAKLAQGLRARRLFDLAETYCRERLTNPELDPTTQTLLTLELIRTQTSRAAISSGSQRVQSWTAAKQTAEDFVARQKSHPRLLLVQVQHALTHLTHGRLLRQEIQADIAPASTREKALSELREATSAFDEIQRSIRKRIPEIRGRTVGAHELSAEQLTTLNNNVRLQSAVCGINRAQLYPPDDQLNRIDALNVGLEKLNAVRRETNSEQPLWWKTELQRAKCLGLLGNYSDAQKLLNAMPWKEANLATQQAVIEQQIRLLIDSNQLQNGPQIVSQVEKITDLSPQLDLAMIELMMRLAQTGDQGWRSKAAEQLTQIESNHGAYWGRRAELLVIGTTGISAHSNSENSTDLGSLDLLMRIGEQALRKDRLEDAAKAFGQAIETAEAEQNWQSVFAATVKQSQVLEKQNLHQSASRKLIDLANRFDESENSPAAHLRGCWNYSRIVNADPDQVADRNGEFLRLLMDHIASWPNATPANQARYWAARHLQNLNRWQEATDQYLAINVNSRFFPMAVKLSATCMASEIRANPDSDSIVKTYTESLLGSLNQTELTVEGREQILLALARIGLTQGTVESAQLEEQLRLANANPTPELKLPLQSWLLVAVVAQGKSKKEIDSSILPIADNEAALLESVLGINTILERQPASATQMLLETKLMIATKALGLGLNDAKQTQWMGESADALLGLGRPDEAVNALSELVKRKPNSAEAQMQLARAFSRIQGEDSTQTALTQWRRVARKLKPQTQNWFEAKYNIAVCMNRLGDSEGALKLLEYLKAIPPGWSKSSWKPKFEQLLIECQN